MVPLYARAFETFEQTAAALTAAVEEHEVKILYVIMLLLVGRQ